uniref:GRANULINS domain-containing protein n=1 Tax=Mesocestoides corti TaxID=53468 RepID=A0A5K3F5C9_MESCO
MAVALRFTPVLLVVLCAVAISGVGNLRNWASSFLDVEACEPRVQKGEWCEWAEWGPCEFDTCTRRRTRQCACPMPADWSSGACKSIIPQDEMRLESTLRSHTRFVRRTSKGRCKIPFFANGTYHGDCIKTASSTLEHCPLDEDPTVIAACDPTVEEMEERDVGACDNWRLAQGWAQASHFT